jgi:hypothetical protein
MLREHLKPCIAQLEPRALVIRIVGGFRHRTAAIRIPAIFCESVDSDYFHGIYQRFHHHFRERSSYGH